MKLSDIGEFGFIERLSKNFEGTIDKSVTGIGDDCAILPLDQNDDQVVTTDLLVEDIHFIRTKTKAVDLGHKTLAVNLSDIAAMGATPVASFLSLAIPSNLEIEFLDDFMEGYRQLSQKYNVLLLGGDTTQSPDKLVINVCVLGKIEKGKSRLRSLAHPGDVICVTGPLGDSAAGLKFLQENITPVDNMQESLVEWHNRPEPAIREGIWLAKQPGVRAMMDISDGIASDLKHILKSSGVGASISMENIPLSDALIKTSALFKWNSEEIALTGGEDYRLLVTIEKEHFNDISTRYKELFPSRLEAIGSIRSRIEAGKIEWTKNGRIIEFSRKGFNHFIKNT